MLQQDKFTPKNDTFNPLETFKFIMDVFKQQADIQQSSLSF